MKYNPKIHPPSLVLKSILGLIEFFFQRLKYNPTELIVVNYHGTPKKFLSNFETQLQFLKKHFNIIDPIELGAYYSDKSFLTTKASLLLTFDDGLKNNLGAAEILKRYGINAYFFIIPNFIDTETSLQKEYYLKNIRPQINTLIDNEPSDFVAFSWDNVKSLLNEGHSIGSHTFTHCLVESESSVDNSIHEIVESKIYIENKIGVTINSFCSINNTLLSVGKKEKDLIEGNYKFHFTTFPGSNFKDRNPLLIKRRNIESFWLLGAVCYSLGKLDLFRWKKRIKLFIGLSS